MSAISDPIADLLTRIRNSACIGNEEVSIPASKLKIHLSEILKEEGYIDDFTYVPDLRQGVIILQLRYDDKGKSVIKEIKRQSKPSRRVYVSKDKLPKVRNGLGTAIISTSRGVMTDSKARRENIGGEYVCSIW